MAKVNSKKKKDLFPINFLLGEVIAHKDKCSMCQGSQIIEEKKSLDVVILPGYTNGKKIKFSGENDQLVRIKKIS